MAAVFDNVLINKIHEDGSSVNHLSGKAQIRLSYDPAGISVKVLQDEKVQLEFPVSKTTECCKAGKTAYIFSLSTDAFMIVLDSTQDCQRLSTHIQDFKSGQATSVFSERTEEASASQYFQFYSYLSQQQNMLQDFIRTGTYQRAILSNAADFTGKVVLDVGAGSGILSFFAAQAGAKKVYAVEASSMSEHAARLVAANNLQHVIQVVAGKIEEINLAEKVDMIISEPMGYMLYNERMLETYLHAKKWLKPGGKLFPSRGDLHIAPFRDDALYMEQYSKANFWYQNSFHGVNLTSLRERAAEEYFRQPVVDTFDVRICLAKAVRHVLDFSTAEERDLHRIDIPVEFHMLETGTVHGLAFWFDVAFCGSQQTVWLSTAPTEPLTHWYQVRCLLRHPLPAKEGQMLTGRVLMVANQRQSYDVTITLQVEATGVSSTVTLDLKNPLFRYTGAAPAAPPGYNSVSPSEKHWATVDAQGAKHALSLLHGMTVNGLGEVAMDTSGLQNTVLNVESLVNQAAIHPGSIPAAALSSGRPVAATSAPKRPAPAAASSRATAVRPAQGRPAAAATTADPAPPQPQPQQYPLSQALMIGDYVTLAGSFRQ
ncbi:histone-arginine methyltransferase CARMER-like [Amphibalanus amphitrite]|uniref:histone-arginine methyltransferase CARMER-like n=1 Tax=Amphibalanus amphitrite TaxID=1232801 RepID=UPI001C8FD60C|nr:histone-arginine methyltransferase CARMER-like [Amphibalanus amphitrite]